MNVYVSSCILILAICLLIYTYVIYNANEKETTKSNERISDIINKLSLMIEEYNTALIETNNQLIVLQQQLWQLLQETKMQS